MNDINLSFPLSPRTVPIGTLMLHSHPQLVHFSEILQNEFNTICDVLLIAKPTLVKIELTKRWILPDIL